MGGGFAGSGESVGNPDPQKAFMIVAKSLSRIQHRTSFFVGGRNQSAVRAREYRAVPIVLHRQSQTRCELDRIIGSKAVPVDQFQRPHDQALGDVLHDIDGTRMVIERRKRSARILLGQISRAYPALHRGPKFHSREREDDQVSIRPLGQLQHLVGSILPHV